MAKEGLLHRRRRGRAPLWLAAMLLSGLLAACASHHHPPPGGTDGPPWSSAPLDALTEQERRLAIDRARADARVRELVGADARVGSVLFQVLKSDSPQEPRPRRFAAVLFYGVTSQQGARAVVDLEAQQVVEVERIDPFGVPLGLDDLQEAWALAQREEAVRSLLGTDVSRFRVGEPGTPPGSLELEVQGMPVVGATAQDPCWQRRCLALLFRRGNRYLEGVEVLVDLTGDRVTVSRRSPDGPERRHR